MTTVRDLLHAERPWRRAVLGLAALALVLRLGIAAGTGGGMDLRIYYNFAHLAAGGGNPYDPPPGFPLPALFGDNLPLEVGLYAGLIKLHDAQYTLRALFALADAGVIVLVGLYWPRPREWRAAFIAFYAVSPLVLGSWTATSEDKTLLFLMFTATLLALERDRPVAAWGGTAALAAFKGFSVFFAPLMALHTWRTRGLRTAAACLAGFVVLLAAAHMPWWPDNLDVYQRRSAHLSEWVPGHAAPTQILSKLGIYDPIEVKVGVPLLLMVIFVAYWRRRIAIGESLILASAATLVLQPEHSYPRALFAALPFLYVVRLTQARWLAIWVVATISSILIYFQQERGQLGGYGSFAHMLSANMLLCTVLVFYARDKLSDTGATPECVPTSSPVPASPTTS